MSLRARKEWRHRPHAAALLGCAYGVMWVTSMKQWLISSLSPALDLWGNSMPPLPFEAAWQMSSESVLLWLALFVTIAGVSLGARARGWRAALVVGGGICLPWLSALGVHDRDEFSRYLWVSGVAAALVIFMPVVRRFARPWPRDSGGAGAIEQLRRREQAI